jgi:hypothetical protein
LQAVLVTIDGILPLSVHGISHFVIGRLSSDIEFRCEILHGFFLTIAQSPVLAMESGAGWPYNDQSHSYVPERESGTTTRHRNPAKHPNQEERR